MYVPPFNAMNEQELRPLVAAAGSAEFITLGDGGYPQATRLPIMWSDERLIFHMAIANPHWRDVEVRTPALAVVTGPDGYVSPSWYPTKAEHGRVVPTWNYSAIHFRGRATVQRDSEWLRAAVTNLTDQNEAHRENPWEVADAPDSYIAQMLKAIVGIEFEIDGIEAKAKRSQNRSEGDRSGVIAGLQAEANASGQALATQMKADLGRG